MFLEPTPAWVKVHPLDMAKPPKPIRAAQLTPKLDAELQRISAETELSISWLIRRALRLLIREYDRTGRVP